MDGASLSTAASSLASLLGILLILALVAFVLRRLRARLPRSGAKTPGGIDIIASRLLGGQQSLVIAEADGVRFLIGVSRAGITCIGRLNGPARD